ncbi:MAG: P-loop NTPase, partial [Candidatus Omnitrophica bacterium]|nr:P-loop NTPase [Candidatus Omnitrophota bacterium]
MITEQNVLQALKHIIDPDFKKDIVTLGFVQNIKINGSDVAVDIVLTTPACPIKEEFRAQAEKALIALPGVRSVKINMTAQQAPQSQTPAAGTPPSLKNVGAIIAVSSCKGGVGKSTMAGALAQELAHRGYRVGLLDADIHGPSIPTLFHLNDVEVHVNQQNQILPIEKDNLKLMSFGFLLGDAPAVMRGPIVTRYIQQLLFHVSWGELDYLFIDMPPGTGDIQLTITQSIKLTGAVIVTTRQSLSLVDVSRGILMFERVNVPILGLIENMAYFTCDSCDKKHYIFGESHANSLSERFGIPTLAEVPLLPQLTHKFETYIGNSFVQHAVDHVVRAVGKSLREDRSAPGIAFDAKTVTLKWNDGRVWKVDNKKLRASCQCALCINEMTGEKLIDESKIRLDIAATQVTPLGNYAIGVTWNDGHSSGIYPYKR